MNKLKCSKTQKVKFLMQFGRPLAIGDHPRTRKTRILLKVLEAMVVGYTACLADDWDMYITSTCRTRAVLRDKECILGTFKMM